MCALKLAKRVAVRQKLHPLTGPAVCDWSGMERPGKWCGGTSEWSDSCEGSFSVHGHILSTSALSSGHSSLSSISINTYKTKAKITTFSSAFIYLYFFYWIFFGFMKQSPLFLHREDACWHLLPAEHWRSWWFHSGHSAGRRGLLVHLMKKKRKV